MDINFGIYTRQKLTSHSGEWYSILYQGLFISFLGCLADLNVSETPTNIISAIRKSVDFVIDHGEKHNICIPKDNVLQLNEFPNDYRSEVLNGSLVYAVALESVEAFLSTKQKRHLELVRRSICLLVVRCDVGYWSLYQPHTDNYSTPDYHNLHTTLLGDLLKRNNHHYNSLNTIYKKWSVGVTRRDIRISALIKKIRWTLSKN